MVDAASVVAGAISIEGLTMTAAATAGGCGVLTGAGVAVAPAEASSSSRAEPASPLPSCEKVAVGEAGAAACGAAWEATFSAEAAASVVFAGVALAEARLARGTDVLAGVAAPFVPVAAALLGLGACTSALLVCALAESAFVRFVCGPAPVSNFGSFVPAVFAGGPAHRETVATSVVPFAACALAW